MPRERRSRATHASGWALRRTHAGAPTHAVVPERVARPFRTAIWLLTAALIAALALLGGTAYASLSSSGAGSGGATTVTVKSVTIEASATPTSTLLPGGKADIALAVTNPNTFPVTITALTAGTGPITVMGAAGCTATDATVAVTPKVGLGRRLAPGSNVVDITTGAVMGTSSASACQHATFHVPVELTVEK